MTSAPGRHSTKKHTNKTTRTARERRDRSTRKMVKHKAHENDELRTDPDRKRSVDVIGTVQGAGNGYDDPGSVHVDVTAQWDIELVVEGRDGGLTARVFLAVDPGIGSVVALARLLLEAERRVGELAVATGEAAREDFARESWVQNPQGVEDQLTRRIRAEVRFLSESLDDDERDTSARRLWEALKALGGTTVPPS